MSDQVRRNTQISNHALIAASFDVIRRASITEIMIMRTTLALDDDLIEKATGVYRPYGKNGFSSGSTEGLDPARKRETIGLARWIRTFA